MALKRRNGKKDPITGHANRVFIKKNPEIVKSTTRNLRIQMGFSLSIRAQGN